MENPLAPCESGSFRNEFSICENCSVYCYTISNNGKKLPDRCIEPCNKMSTTQIVTILNNTHTGSSKTKNIIVNSTISIDNDQNSSKAKIIILALIVTSVLIAVVLVVIIYYYRKKRNNSSKKTEKDHLEKPNNSASAHLLHSNSPNHNEIDHDPMNGSIRMGELLNNNNSSNYTESEKRNNSFQRRKEGHLKKPNDSSDLTNINIVSEGETLYQSAASDSLLHSNSPNHNEIDQDSMNGSIQMEELLNNYSSNDTESEDCSFNMPSRQLTEMIHFPSRMPRQESSFGKTSYVA